MGSPSDGMKSALFRAAPGGWVFRSPNPWVFGDTPHYLVNDFYRRHRSRRSSRRVDQVSSRLC